MNPFAELFERLGKQENNPHDLSRAFHMVHEEPLVDLKCSEAYEDLRNAALVEHFGGGTLVVKTVSTCPAWNLAGFQQDPNPPADGEKKEMDLAKVYRTTYLPADAVLSVSTNTLSPDQAGGLALAQHAVDAWQEGLRALSDARRVRSLPDRD